MDTVRFFHLPKTVGRSFLEKAVKAVLVGEKKQDFGANIVFVPASQIKQLSARYLKRNLVTDILTFRQEQEKSPGDILICLKQVRTNARIFNQDPKIELARVVIHGVLHLFGYEDEKGKTKALTMERKQEKYLKALLCQKDS